jgi:REP element-mobilizing transposase RayT
MNPAKQLKLFKSGEKAHGGSLRNKLKGRGARSLSTKESMHLILKSSKATYLWSFRKYDKDIKEITSRFSTKYGVKILSLANVGNHLHFHIQLTNRYAYYKWIRAITSAIAMKVTGINRWTGGTGEKFWDYRPFTRVIKSFRALLTLKDYLLINKLEGLGVPRAKARVLMGCQARVRSSG